MEHLEDDGVIDSLPYIDGEFTSEANSLAAECIKKELGETPFPHPRLAPEYVFKNSEAIRKEFLRIESGIPLKVTDESKFRLEPPKGEKSKEAEAWLKAVQNAQAQIENQNIRLNNLELLMKFGKNVWLLQNYQIDKFKDLCKNQIFSLEERIREVNLERKKTQLRYSRDLQALAYRYRTPIDQI